MLVPIYVFSRAKILSRSSFRWLFHIASQVLVSTASWRRKEIWLLHVKFLASHARTEEHTFLEEKTLERCAPEQQRGRRAGRACSTFFRARGRGPRAGREARAHRQDPRPPQGGRAEGSQIVRTFLPRVGVGSDRMLTLKTLSVCQPLRARSWM